MAFVTELFRSSADAGVVMPADMGVDAGVTAQADVTALPDAGPTSLLDTIASVVADPQQDPAVQADANPAEKIPTMADIQNQLDAINNTTWRPEVAPSHDKISTDVVRGNQATANMVTDATQKLGAVNAAEADLNKLSAAVEAGKVAEPEMPAAAAKDDATPTAAGMARGAVADVGVTAMMTAINPVLGAAYGAVGVVSTVRNLFNAGTTMASENGQGSYGAPTASSTPVKLTGAEAREYRRSGHVEAQDVSPAKNTFAAASAGYTRGPTAPTHDEFGAIPHHDLVFGANNMEDSMDGLKGVKVEESPAIAAMRGEIKTMQQAFTWQRDTGKDLQDVYKDRAANGVELNNDTLADAMNRGMKLNTGGGPVINGMVA